MPEQVTQIHLASEVLRSPHLFDGLGPADVPGEGPTRKGRRKAGAQTGSVLRDVLLYAAWKNERVCELRLPEFCAMMGYERSNLTRSCTPEEKEEIRRKNWPEAWVDRFSNVLGLALVRLLTSNLIVEEEGSSAKRMRISASKIIDHVDAYETLSTGTLLSFTLSKSILSQNRNRYQTPILEEYLSLRTEGTKRKEGHPGSPDEAARRMYLHLTWLRQYYDHLVREKDYDGAKQLLHDYGHKYLELLKVAKLADRRKYWPEKRIASELRKLLGRVGSIASIRLVPDVRLYKGNYEVIWREQVQLDAAQPEENPYKPPVDNPCEPAPARWGSAPAPRATRPARKKPTTPSAKIKPMPPKPKPAQRAGQPDKKQLLSQLEDATNSLRWLQSDDAPKAASYAGNPAKLEQHIQDATAKLRSIQDQIKPS